MAAQQELLVPIRTPDQRLRVFISSTLAQLAAERAAARGAIERLHLTPVMFEEGARPHPPRTLYRAYLQQSAVFVGIYWQRYGWVAPDMEISGLEDEWLLSEGKPRLIYVKRAREQEPRLEELLDRIKDEASFKSFESPEELRELLSEDIAHFLSERFEAAGSPLSAELADKRTPLPVPLTRLVGRDRDIEELVAIFGAEDVRLVTLVGVGGIGKSRLALEVARRFGEPEPGSVAFVDLTTVSDPELLPRSLASGIGVTQEADQPLMETIKDALRRRPALLVLDNFEQIAVAAPRIAEILGACAQVKALVTSRVPLGVRGERQYQVRPLANPDAVQLFVDRARDAKPTFQLTDDSSQAVQELCERLDRLPLALELAAARIPLLAPRALLARLGTRLDLTGRADHPERQRTLRATLDWSHELLDEDARRLFAQVAVFSGGWTLEAAERVCALDGGPGVLDALASLVDKGLVSIDESYEGEPRFRMLETVREYAAEKLFELPERESIRRRHAEYFMELCEQAAHHFYGPAQKTWFARLDADLDNVRALMPWALATGEAELAAHAFGVIWTYWWLRGLVSELLPMMDELAPLVSVGSPQVRAEVALSQGGPRFLTGDMEAARQHLREAIALAAESGNEPIRATAATTLAATLDYETERDQQRALLADALTTCRRIDWPWGVAFVQLQLGALVMRGGEAAESIDPLSEALAIVRELEDESLTLLLLDVLGAALAFDYDLERSREVLIEGAEVCRRAGNPEGFAYCLEAFSGLAYRQRNLEVAAKLLGAARTIRDQISVLVWPLLEPIQQQLAEWVRRRLGDEKFEDGYAAGRLLKPDEGLALALDGTRQAAASSS